MRKAAIKNSWTGYVENKLYSCNWWILGGILSLISATVITYWSTLNYPFQFDDLMNITKNYAIRNFDLKLEFLRSSRWIGELSNKLNFSLGHFQPWTYRLVNLSIHITTGLLLYALVLQLCQNQKQNNFSKIWAQSIAFLTGALFLLHPVQSQTVNYAIQARLEGLAALFVLATLLMMLQWMRTLNVGWLCLANLVGFLACGTKEVVVVLPLLAMLIDWFFVAEQQWSDFKKRWWGHLSLSITIIGTIGYYLGTKFMFDAVTLNAVSKNNRGNIVSLGVLNQIGATEYLISQFKVLIHYLTIFIWPQSLCVEYDWKLVSNIFQPEILGSIFALTTIGLSTVYFVWQKRATEFCFASFWFFICLAPRSSIVPCAELVCDYKTYLASCGMMFLMACGLTKIFIWLQQELSHWLPNNRLAHAACLAAAAILPLSFATGTRNQVWSSSELFWQDVVTKAPTKARAHNNYAVAMCEKGKFLEAVPHFKQAIALDKIYCDPWSNLSVAYSMLGQHEEAMSALKQAINIFPEYPEAHNNLGAMLLNAGKLDEAEDALKQAISLRPHYGKAHLNLGRVYGKKGDNEKGFEYYKLATEGDLDNIEGFSCLGFEALRLGKFEEAVKALEKAVKLGANSPVLVANLAGAYCNTNNEAEGMRLFKILHQHNPKDPSIAYNLALCYQNQGQPETALKLLQAIKLDQSSPENCISLMAECLEKTAGLDKAKEWLNQICLQSLPEKHSKVAQGELTRVKVQEKLNKSGGILTGKDLQEAFGAAQQTTTSA